MTLALIMQRLNLLFMSANERVVDAIGKASIASGVATEVGKQAGWLGDNVTIWQIISAAGVIWLIIDRAIRLYWDYKKMKREESGSAE